MEQIIKTSKRLRIIRCNCCWIERKQYKVSFSKIHLEILLKVLRYCKFIKNNEFNIKDLDEMFKLTKTEYWNLNVLIRFGLLYRPEHKKQWHYWLPTKRAIWFIKWKYLIHEYYWRDSITKEIEYSENKIRIDQIKQYKEFLQDNWLPNYVDYK